MYNPPLLPCIKEPLMTSTIQAVAFDKDGVTFDSERIYAESLLQTLVALPQPPADAPALAEACSGFR